MAYAAVVSLKNTIHRLQTSPRFSIASPSREILQLAYEDVRSLQEVLRRLDDNRNRVERMKPLEDQITEVVCNLEDVFELNESALYLSRSKSHGDECGSFQVSLDLQELRQDINFFRQTAKKMETEYMKELYRPLLDEEGNDAPDSSSMYLNKSEMIGVKIQFRDIRSKLLLEVPEFPYMSIFGMAGIGKTALAVKILEDPSIVRNFDCRAFVRVGQKHQQKKMLRSILSQVLDCDGNEMLMEGDEELQGSLMKCLTGKRYLIVLDDVWEADLWKIIRRFPNEYNGSWILVTTRLREVAEFLSFFPYNMPLLNKEESWDLLREKVFDKEQGPLYPQLEKAGMKIAENCEGLPLLILAVAKILSGSEKTLELWTKVAADKHNSVFVDACDQIFEVLYSSYGYLPQHLKACFLYMGAFPQSRCIRPSNLINLWSAEGFLEPDPYESLEILAKECLKELLGCNLVVARQSSMDAKRVKAYGLHIVFWNLCKREALNSKFLHILNSYKDHGVLEGMESNRRFSVLKNVLFGIKDVRDSMASCLTARSLLCTGPYHQYQVRTPFCLRLLRVLDALKIRFYQFPLEVLELVQLRYLALTCNSDLPCSISKLWNLQYLIIHQHLRSAISSFVPLQIWDLQELKYLQIIGRNLPYGCGAILPNLVTLLDVGALTCNSDILGRIPNLNKLRVRLELALDSAEPLSCFNHISNLWTLESLQCVVVNPRFDHGIIASTPPFPDFVLYLRKLTLNGCGFPWIDMRKMAKLPYLQVLKLQCYAFRGEKWEAKWVYAKLEYLLIEDTDLVNWTAGREVFPELRHLSMKSCYKLQEIPRISSLQEIEMVDCNSSGVANANSANYCRVYASSSWDDDEQSS